MTSFPLLCSWWRAVIHSAKQNVEHINVSRINVFLYVLCMVLLLLYGPTLCDVGTEGGYM